MLNSCILKPIGKGLVNVINELLPIHSLMNELVKMLKMFIDA